MTDDVQDAILQVPAKAWAPAYDGDGRARPGAWVAEITGMLDLSSWPEGMRVIVRKERPHPGAQLRFTDIGGHRFTCFATSTKRGQLADLELRHRRRARCEDRIRCAKDTGLRNLPLHGFTQNQIWAEIVALACDLLAWTQILAFTGPARRWEPKTHAAADLLHRRADRPRRPPAAAPPRRPLALGPRHHHRDQPAPGPARIPADQPRLTPATRKGHTKGPWTPATRRDTRAPALTSGTKNRPGQQPQATNPRSRNIEANGRDW